MPSRRVFHVLPQTSPLRSEVFVLALVVVACGGGAPEPVVTPPPLHITAAPPRARWVFSASEQEIRAKLDLGDHKTLYVGDHGRRELDLGTSGELQHAQTLAEESLGGVLKDDKGRYVFVATDGDTWTSSEPLGALERVKPPRREPLESVTTGRAAIVGIGPGGLVRSTDYGATWKPVEYAGKASGHAASVALDTKGNGVLVQLPQRVLVTHDDGATWAPVASPQYGAAKTLRDGSDRVFVIGYHDLRAALSGDKLADTNDVPAAIFPGHPSWEPRTFNPAPTERRALRVRMPLDALGERQLAPRRLLVGDHVVEIAQKDKKAEIRSAPLGDALGAPSSHDDLGDGIFDAKNVASWNGELAYASTDVDDDDDDKPAAKSPTTTIMRSKDFGATWKKEDALQGTAEDGARAIALGPRGWTYVGPLCAKRRSSECKQPKIRGAGKQAFDEVGVDETFDSFVFDEAHDKVYALALASGGSRLYEGALGGSKLTRTSMLLSSRAERVAMTVDDQGTLRIFERPSHVVILHERTAKGEEKAARYLDLGLATIAFSGKRGLSIGDHASYETNDAGETWTRVPSNGSTAGISCSAAGCLLAGAQRVGWDLPAVQSTEIVRASTTPPEEQQQTKPPVQHPQVTPVKVACKVSGKGAQVDDNGEIWNDGAGAVRWARVSTDFSTGAVNVAYADKDAVHRAQLFAAPGAATMEVRTGTLVNDTGIVGGRFKFARRSATGKLNPVSVDLAWWSPSKPQVRRGTLQAVKPFRVSRFSFSGRARVVDGGVIFQGGYGDVIHFLHDDGKSEELTAPPIEFEEAWHSGKRWVLLDADNEVLEMAVSDDGGKTWALRGWAFGVMATYGDSNLETVGDKLLMRANDAVYEVAWPVAADPPAGIALDATSKDTHCDAIAFGSTPHQEHLEGGASVTMDLAGATYTAVDRVVHDSATGPNSGKMCTSAYLMEQGRDKAAYLYPDKGGGWSGWSYRADGDKTTVEPLSCK